LKQIACKSYTQARKCLAGRVASLSDCLYYNVV